MRCVDDLDGGRQTLVDETKQVALSTRVQRQPWFVEEHDHRLTTALELGERSEKREEPLEAGRALSEVVGEGVPSVLDPDVEECLRDRLSVRLDLLDLAVNIELHPQVRVLLPVLEDLAGQLVSDCLELGLPVFVVITRQCFGSCAREAEQRPCGLVSRRPDLRAPRVKRRDVDAAFEARVLGEVEESREPVLKQIYRNAPGLLAVELVELGAEARDLLGRLLLLGIALVAPESRAHFLDAVEIFHILVKLDGLLADVSALEEVLHRTPRIVRVRPARAVLVVTTGDGDLRLGHDSRSERVPKYGQVLVVQPERRTDRHGITDCVLAAIL